MLGVAAPRRPLSDDSVSADSDPGPLAKRVALALGERSGGWLEREAMLPKGYGSYILSGNRRKLGPDFMGRIAKALGVSLTWLMTGTGPMTEGAKTYDPPAGKLLFKISDLPGLRDWLIDHPEALTVSELVRGIAVYDETKPASRSDGQPFEGWEAFFDDVKAGRLAGPKRKGDQAAAEALERSQLPPAARKRLKR